MTATARQSRAPRAARSTASPTAHRTAATRARPAPVGPRPPKRPEGMPVEAAIELVRWGFGRLRALVADYPEEAEAVDRVAEAVEAEIRGTRPNALAQLDEADILTTASILITASEPDPALVEAIGVGLDVLAHGARSERTPTAAPAPVCVRRAGAHRAPLIVRHLFLVP